VKGVHLVVPGGIDDPARVSGGNRYDREVCGALRGAGWTVTPIAVEGPWPRAGAAGPTSLARSLDALPDGAVVLVDGLIASGAGAVLVPRSRRLRLVLLVHMLFGRDAVEEGDEAAVLSAARAVVTTSDWTRRRLLERYRVPAGRVHVARPGTAPAPVSAPAPAGGRLLCVGTVSALKGQDLLLAALGGLRGLLWRCSLVGPLDREPHFVAVLADRARATGVADRVRMPGTRTGAALRREYADADLLVVPSRAETYGMVVTEALAAGIPVLATSVGGLPEAVGATPGGRPGMLVPPEDHRALSAALARWLTDAGLRSRLRDAALRRRGALADWRDTGEQIGRVLAAVAAEPAPQGIRVSR
jgi:glycosyltransferase involved in cell wall biosynthesis